MGRKPLTEETFIAVEVLVARAWTLKVIVVRGKSPVVVFIEALAAPEQRKVLAFLERVSQVGPMAQRSRPLRGKIFELKPTAQVRLLYFLDGRYSLVMTNGFVKKQAKTPPGEIERAESLRRSFSGEY